MKKWLKMMMAVAVCFGLLSVMSFAVEAKTISTVNASVSGGNITVSGTAEAGTLACAILVYDATESTLLDMETCGVNADNTYSYTLAMEFAKGSYVIRVADYDGGAYVKTTATVAAAVPVKSESPKTGDDAAWAVLGLTAAMMMLAAFGIRKSDYAAM